MYHISNERRVRTEKSILRKTLKTVVEKGYNFFVCDGVDDYGPYNKVTKEAMDNGFAADECYVFVYDGDKRIGFIWLVFGNYTDVLTDYSANDKMEEICEEVQNWVDKKYIL